MTSSGGRELGVTQVPKELGGMKPSFLLSDRHKFLRQIAGTGTPIPTQLKLDLGTNPVEVCGAHRWSSTIDNMTSHSDSELGETQ